MDSIPQVTAEWGDDLAATYDEAVDAWRAASTGEARRLYHERVFPLACERLRDARADGQALDLLYVPVGTQAYAPILAVVANPAACVALLETDGSYPFGLQVERALARTAQFLHVRIDPVDVVDISQKMRDVYETRGLPRGARVAADVTGGRKTMTAAVAAVGSLLGWQLFYIEGTQERALDGFSHHERVIELPNVLDVFGGRSRDLAFRLMQAGAWAAAVTELEALIAQSGASADDRLWLDVARAAAALREGDVAAVRGRIRRAARFLGQKSELAESLVSAAARGGAPQAALLRVAARVCRDEGQRALARAHEARAAELTGDAREVRALAGAARQLDALLGRGLAKRFQS